MTLTCAKCKQKYDLPDGADKDRPFVCDACYEAILREAQERIRIKAR